jgi:hypothetical protein
MVADLRTVVMGESIFLINLKRNKNIDPKTDR